MALKPVVDSLDAVPEALRGEYTERDGKFHLAVEGLVGRERLDEFRNNNVTLRRQMEELEARFAGIDPDQARELAIKAQKERDKKLIDAGKVDELVNERVSAMRGEHEQVTTSLKTQNATLMAQLEGLIIDNQLRAAAAEMGVLASAVDDVLLRGKRVFSLEGNAAVAKDGDKVLYGKNSEPLGIKEWVGDLTAHAPHLFQPSTGGGSRDQTGGVGPAVGRVEKYDQKGFLANLEAIAKGKVRVS